MRDKRTSPRKDLGNFRDTINDVARTRGSAVTVFGDFCKVVACALSAGQRESEYMEVMKLYDKAEQGSFAKAMAQLTMEMEQKPFQDLLGPYYQENASKSTVETRGEFYTPPSISSLIARITINPDEIMARGKPVSVSDPCIGSGGMILAAAELFVPSKAVDLLRVIGTDISPLACDMAFINTSFWGIPAAITWGNTLTLEEKKTWKNFHWHRVGEDGRLALMKMQSLLDGPLIEPISKPIETPKADFTFPEADHRQLNQLDLFD